MPLTIDTKKKFAVKFVKKDEFLSETETFEALGRSDAMDQIRTKYEGCEILECWESNYRTM